MVISNTERDDKECVTILYYLLSRKMPVKKVAVIVKSHWAIENELHCDWIERPERTIAVSGRATPTPTSASFAESR